MTIIATLLNITGGLCLFLYGMKIMSDGIQRAAGDRLQSFLNYITGNRFSAVLTGLAITAIVQSSSAATVMLVSLVNAGLLTLTQSIGVIMGANIGTTVTAWIVSLVGFSLKLSKLALPAIGIGFIFRIAKWKHRTKSSRDTGDFILGFGLLFMGLDFLTKSMPALGNIDFIANVSDMGFLTYVIGIFAGMSVTLLLHSSSAATAITLTMAYNGVISYELAASMILGANIGTTIDAALASIGTKTNAKRAALVHVLFNVLGTLWAIPLLKPLLVLVDFITPGTITPGMVYSPVITTNLAMLHTVFNISNTVIFLPFVNQFAWLVKRIIKDDPNESGAAKHYQLIYTKGIFQNTPEINILRAEKEIRDMAGVAMSMFTRFSEVLQSLPEINNKDAEITGAESAVTAADKLSAELKQKEAYADEMHEQIAAFLIECAKKQLGRKSEKRVSQLLRVISDLENMTDDCCSMSYLLENGVKKGRLFEKKEMEALSPYLQLVNDFLNLVKENLGSSLTRDALKTAIKLEEKIDKSRNKLRKLGRKRLESGKDVKTELMFIELVRRIEKLGDYCYDVVNTIKNGV